MENIIDTEYREISVLEDKGTEVLTAEANAYYQQAESLAQASMMSLAESGRRLNIIKERGGHGNWEEWMKSNLLFSPKKAQRIMKLAKNIDENVGVFSNPSTLTDIGISKVWALLGAPEEVQKEVVENPEMQLASVKEFEEEIKRLKQEKAKADEKRIEAEKRMDFEIEKFQDELERTSELKEEIKALKKDKKELESKKTDPSKNAEYEKKIADLDKKLKRTTEALEEAKADLKRQPEKVIDEEAISRAVEEEKAKAEAMVNTLEDEKKNLEARIARLKKEADKDMIVFAQMYKGLRHSFLEIIDYINSMDEEKQKKMTMALQKKLSELEDMAWQ